MNKTNICLIVDCGGTIRTPRILNPIMENDSDYYEYTSCHWLIIAPPKKSVLLRFEQFNISTTVEKYGFLLFIQFFFFF